MMVSPLQVDHPKGDRKPVQKPSAFFADVVDTYDGKIHIEWDTDAAVPNDFFHAQQRIG